MQCRRPRFDTWVGKIPWRRERLPSPVFWLGEFRGLYSPWSRKEPDTTRDFHFHTQYSQSSNQIFELVKNLLKKKQQQQKTQKTLLLNFRGYVYISWVFFFFLIKILKKNKSKYMIYITLLVVKENYSNLRNETNIDQNKSFQYHDGTTDPLEGLSLSLKDKQLWYTICN